MPESNSAKMQDAVVIFPNQLFEYHPGLSKGRKVFLIEEQRYFSDFRFHKKKLMLHRASMQAYKNGLESQGHEVHYIDFEDSLNADLFLKHLQQFDIEEIYVVEILDYLLEERVQKEATKTKIRISELESPGFLSPKNWLSSIFKNSKHYSQTRFYIAQRKRLNILVGEDGKPLGGKWSFDPENRKKIPKGFPIPKLSFPRPNKYLKDAKIYVEKHFADNPGTTDDFIYPITHNDAEKWLHDFLKNRLRHFGEYEDAMVRDEPFLFHSILTPMLNIGLLTPSQVIERTLGFAERNSIPMNSLEGFIRQIIGWREFMRAIYLLKGNRERTTNIWQHKRKTPSAFYTGTTGIEPVDTVIRRLNKYAYAHHIERLMIFGNFMLLCEIDPDEIYKWFMELFIDAYDWVMVPNVYGMSQYADGGLIATKPYISSSNYIRKMSDFPKGAWCDVWDGLYWRFIHKHRDLFKKNPRMRLMTLQLERMKKDKLNKHLTIANEFLEDFWKS